MNLKYKKGEKYGGFFLKMYIFAIELEILEVVPAMRKLKKLILVLGSNTDQESNIDLAKELLMKTFKDVTFTRYIWTPPINMDSADFLNCLAVTYSWHGYPQIHRALKQLERQMGNTKANRSKGIVKIDVDVLKYGDIRYHEDDWKRAYVRTLLQDLAEE